MNKSWIQFSGILKGLGAVMVFMMILWILEALK